ncbi:hypothetical protein ABEL47_01630 [Escherichia coli]
MGGLFGGGGGSSTSKITRPDYVMNMVNSLSDQLKNTHTGDYTADQFAGLNTNQQEALSNLMNNPQFSDMANNLISSGEEGVNNLNNVYDQISGLQDITPQQISDMANQFYDYGGTQNLIEKTNQQLEAKQATDVNPQIAENLAGSGNQFGSSSRLLRDRANADLATQEQNSASDITNQAYSTARDQAQSLLSGNLSNRRNILGALANNAQNQINYANTGAQMQQQNYQNQLSAMQQMQQDRQNQLDYDYNNRTNQQNWGLNDIQNRLNLTGALSDQYGMTSKTTQMGGGTNWLSTGLSVAGGVVGGIYGGPAGAMIGSQLGGMAGTAISN